jgi:hypothetical protein
MSKQQAIGQIRTRAERDLSISDGALRLVMRLCSHIYTDPKATLEKPFPLPWSTVAVWCGLKDADAAARRIAELVDRHYLKCDGLRGCPPINHFFLVPNYRSKAVIDCPSRGVNDCPSGGVNNYRSKGAHHISNSFQEERLEERGEMNGSLRSKETKGNEKAAAPQKMTETDRQEAARQLRELQKNIKRS